MRTHQYAHKKRASQSFRTPISRPSEVQSSVQPPPIQAKSNEEGLAEHAERLRKFQRLGNSMMQMGPPRLDNNTTSSVQPKPWIQRKLTIGEPGDKYEQEADRVASQVVQTINAPTSEESNIRQSIQREKDLEGVMYARGFQAAIQRNQTITGEEASTDLESAINSARGSGKLLDAGLQQSMGLAMGADFSRVRVHTDARSDQLNRSIQARAFTSGQDVFFREGAYQPTSRGGQELIAHELTHVVQQGELPTMEAKEEEINDDSRWEHEVRRIRAKEDAQKKPTRLLSAQEKSATNEGSLKALSVIHPAQLDTTSDPQVIQAMSVRKEPQNKQIYAVADAGDVVTGMGTPNHELYVEKAKQISDINNNVAKSKMNFKSDKKVKLFSKDYFKVRVGFKENEKVTAAEIPKDASFFDKVQGKHKVKEHEIDLDKSYHQRVAPNVAKYSAEKRSVVLEKIKEKPWGKNFKGLQPAIRDLNDQLELLKKLIINNQAKEDYHDVVNDMEPAYGFVATVESILFGEKVKTADIVDAKELVNKYFKQLETVREFDELLDEALVDVFSGIAMVQKHMPKDLPVNMLMIHSVNYEESMIESIKVGDPMFYRACDVMASTLMGNEITKENAQQIKTYRAGGKSGAFHYAAKILESGSDWVTLESFAAGTRDQKIIGQTDDNSLRNLDNSWNYIMYGSVKKKHTTANSEEDNYFELYTKLRYYLKGIQEPGSFGTKIREHLTSRIPKNAFDDVVSSSERSKKIYERLVYNEVLDSSGKVLNPEYLKEDYIKLRIEKEDQKHAKAISEKLISIYEKPYYSYPYVQASANNEVRNILGWITNIGLPINPDNFDFEFGQRLAMQEESAKSVHDAAWEQLMISMLQNK